MKNPDYKPRGERPTTDAQARRQAFIDALAAKHKVDPYRGFYPPTKNGGKP